MIFNKSARGSSLSEVLIALLLSSLMMSAMMSSYVSIKKHYLILERQFEQMQEKILLINYFRQQIQSAGFWGSNHQNNLIFDEPLLNKNALLILNKSDKQLPKHVRLNAVSDSQILKITSLEAPFYSVVKSQLNSEVITLDQPLNIKLKQEIVISDQQHVSLRTIKKISYSKYDVILNKPLKNEYKKNSIIAKLKTTIFYIRAVGKHRALYVSDGTRSDELSRDLINLHIDKQTILPYSLLTLVLKRLNHQDLNFHVTMLGF